MFHEKMDINKVTNLISYQKKYFDFAVKLLIGTTKTVFQPKPIFITLHKTHYHKTFFCLFSCMVVT